MSGWGQWFHSALASSEPQIWVLAARSFDWISSLGSDWQVSTLPLEGHVACLGAEGYEPYTPSVASVGVRTWQSTGGGFSIHVAGNDAGRLAMARLAPGSMVGIYAGRPGVGVEHYARIDLGQLVAITQVSDRAAGLLPVYRLDFAPAWAALRRRPAAGFDSKLFNYAGAATAVATGAYVPGSGTLTVVNGALFERQAGGTGILQVTDNTGTNFYLEWTSVTGNTLTVSTTAKFGTTDAAAAIGNVVKNIVYLQGHPASILRRLLVSTGTADFTAGTAGDNGSYDVYPETWGFSISPDDVDMSNLSRLKTDVMTVNSATGTYLVEILVSSAPDNALDWLTIWLRSLGVFLRLHEGRFSAWAAQNPYATLALFSSYGVTDTLLMADRLSWRPIAEPGTHDSSQVEVDGDTYGDDSADSAYASAPVYAIRTRDCTGILRSDLSDHAEDVNGRCSPWDTRVLSELGGQWGSGWQGRQALGELVYVSTPTLGLFLPSQADSGDYLDRAPAMVTAGPVLDLLNARIWLGLTLLPET